MYVKKLIMDEIKKKSSPLKLLNQSQQNFAEMILGWSSSKFVPGISEHRPSHIPSPHGNSTVVKLTLIRQTMHSQICHCHLSMLLEL
jgi:hypothetical protein